MQPILKWQGIELLNVPHIEAVCAEIFDEDAYRLNDIPNGSIVIDVGAFYAEFALLCHIQKQCAVVAYEPSEASYRTGMLNIVLNE